MNRRIGQIAAGGLMLAFALPLFCQVGDAVRTAARNGEETVVRAWLLSRADVNGRSPDGSTALLAAVQGNQPGTVRLLLENGADANLRDKEGYSPLLTASLYAGNDVVRLLLEHGARLEDKADRSRPNSDADLEDPYTPLVYLIMKGQIENIRRLLDAGANAAHLINDRPLAMFAGEHGWIAMVEMLDRAAHPQAAPPGVLRDPYHMGYTPLMFAAASGDLREFQRLLSAGAAWRVETRSHPSLLMCAAQGGNAAIVDIVLRLGARDRKPGWRDWNAVKYAAVRGDTRIVEKLLAAGEDATLLTREKDGMIWNCLSPEMRDLVGKYGGDR